MVITFEVENAGCSSCAGKVRSAISPLAPVQSVVIDEAADTATVQIMGAAQVHQREVDDALELAAAGAGHTYRVKPGSWRVEAA
jgi:copper chaperone CopZ